MTDEDRLAERIRLQEKAAHDYASDLDDALAKGRANIQTKFVRLMYKNGATIDEISKLLELPIPEITELLNI
jgi:hypothetical protein